MLRLQDSHIIRVDFIYVKYFQVGEKYISLTSSVRQYCPGLIVVLTVTARFAAKWYMFCVQGLKSHAVTMFEVGKLSDESMDSFLSELEKVLL